MSNAGRKLLFETALTDTRATDVEGAGSIREDQFGNKYRWVYNADSIDSVVGGPACFDASLYSSANFQKHVLIDTAAGDEIYLAGIFISVIPSEKWGWILSEGKYATANIAQASADSMAADDILVPSTLVATTSTGAGKAFSFLLAYSPGAAFTSLTGAGSMAAFFNQRVRLLYAVASKATGALLTAPQPGYIYIKGM